MPQVVSDAELPSAATLSGLQFNISGIIGPALGGLLVPLKGISSGDFSEALTAILGEGASGLSATNIVGFQVVLARNFLFALFISVIPALMPVVGLCKRPP